MIIGQEDLLVEKPLEGSECLICFQIFNAKVFQCKEGHCACESCWKDHLNGSKDCFLCGKSGNVIKSINDLSRNRLIENQISNFKVWCPNLFKNSKEIEKDNNFGCKEILTFGNLNNHLIECQYYFRNCDNEGCNKVIRNNHQSHHDEFECDCSILGCKYCGKEGMDRITLQSHYSKCDDIGINCEKCNIQIIRKDMDIHLKFKCLESRIKCKYYEYGCSTEVKRNQMKFHMKEVDHDEMIETLFIDLQNSKYNCNLFLQEIVGLEARIDEAKSKYTKISNQLDVFRLIKHYEDSFFAKMNEGQPPHTSNIKLNSTHVQFNFSIIYKKEGQFISSQFKKIRGQDEVKIVLVMINNDSKKDQILIEYRGTMDSEVKIDKLISIPLYTDFNNGWLYNGFFKFKLSMDIFKEIEG